MDGPLDGLLWFYNQRAGVENLIKEANNDAVLTAHPSNRWRMNANGSRSIALPTSSFAWKPYSEWFACQRGGMEASESRIRSWTCRLDAPLSDISESPLRPQTGSETVEFFHA
jgi:hypothetical protein